MSNVLVLEPNADVRALFVRLLRRLGHEPSRTTSTSSASPPTIADAYLVKPVSLAALRSALPSAKA